MNRRDILKLQRDFDKLLSHTNVVHKIRVTSHMIERVFERDLNPTRVARFIKCVLSKYTFSILYHKDFSFELEGEFIVIGKFVESEKGHMYVMQTVLDSGMKVESSLYKKLKYA